MVQSLEQYVAQATTAYQPASNAIKSQIDALSGKLETTNEAINRNYAQQQAGLNRQRNMAAETASMQAAGSGGSFGGAANIANRKYYDQTFVPAVTQLRTGQANELAQARQNTENQRTDLNAQLANLQAQANQQALAQYYSDLEAERNRQAQLKAQREANAAQRYLMEASRNQANNGVKTWDFGNGFSVSDINGQAVYSRNGTIITPGTFLMGTASTNGANWNLWKDIWNNGVSTSGVGSDTISAFNNRVPQGTNGRYRYLFE